MIFDSGDTGESGGYTIANSLRLRSSASAYLSRTVSAGNQQTWTWSGWIKRGSLGSLQTVFGLNSASTNIFTLAFQANDTLRVLGRNASVDVLNITTTAVYRDPSAWMHIVVALDTTQATASNRCRLYVNGSEVTAFSTATYPAQNTSLAWNSSSYTHNIGREDTGSYLDGYQAEICFTNAQQLDPTYFGQFNSDNVWTPKAYTGTYGTNGFKLNFSNGSSLTTLCADSSGNGNNWTATNVSLTAGATYDWMVDTPTVNYATLNPIVRPASGATGMNGANLNTAINTAGSSAAVSTMAVTSGKWYWEVTVTALTTGFSYDSSIGITTNENTSTVADATQLGYIDDGNKWNGTSSVAYGATYTTNDVIGVALDVDTGTLAFYKNNVSQGTAISTGITGNRWFPFVGSNNVASHACNFGQRPFTYTPPTGFKALCTANLPAVTIPNGRKHFDVSLFNGTGSAQNITNSGGFQPDLVWEKTRSAVVSNILVDSVRGATKELYSDATAAEVTNATGITGFLSNGFSIGTGYAANTHVAWQWKAGGAAVTNTAGTITSQVSANTAAGFSIVTYTGTGLNSTSTIGHGLGVVPAMIIVKDRGSVVNWAVWHKGLTGANNVLEGLNTTSAATSQSVWNGSAAAYTPTSSVFHVYGSGNMTNNATAHVAYVFSEVSGFSKFGSYTGNGSTDGPFVFCGFRPRYVLIKRTDTTSHWRVVDTARSAFNAAGLDLYPNLSNAEGSVAFDFLSNGFKPRVTDPDYNASGGTYIFMALAENPFGASNTAPATAR